MPIDKSTPYDEMKIMTTKKTQEALNSFPSKLQILGILKCPTNSQETNPPQDSKSLPLQVLISRNQVGVGNIQIAK